jgi:hypothetical protein
MKSLVGLFAISITIFSLIGCTSGVTVKSTNPLHDGITVMKLTLIEDHYGGQHIVGEIRNDASFPLKSIKLSISITDTDGETVLKDSDEKPITEDSFSPFLGILFPGQSTGFEYSLSPLTNTAAHYQVTFLSAVKMDSQQADVRIEKAHIQDSMYGTSFFIGEVVNLGSQPARVEGMGVAILGDNGQILDMNFASSLVQYLAPANDPDGLDRGTFAIPLRGSFRERVHWQTYLSSIVTTPGNVPAVKLLESRHYVDSMGYFHLVGLVSNQSSISYFFPLIGNVTDEDGNILDSVTGYLPIDLQADSVAAFDLMDWKVVNHNTDLQGLIKKTQIQIDSSRAYPSKLHYFNLITSNVQEYRDTQGLWKFTGFVDNFWPVPFQSVVVIVSIFSGKNHLVATGYQWVQPVASMLGVGSKAQFDLQISLDPTRDPSKYTYQIQAFAEPPW